jgi:hypothetical protein
MDSESVRNSAENAPVTSIQGYDFVLLLFVYFIN